MRRNCEHINAVKMVKVYNRYGEKNGKRLQFKKRWYTVGQLFLTVQKHYIDTYCIWLLGNFVYD